MEIFLALIQNLQNAFCFMAALTGAGLVIGCIMYFPALDILEDDFRKKFESYLKNIFIAFIVFGVLSCIPSVHDIWKVRISLIQLQLASPENIKNSTDTIQRIAKKLECKYLGDCKSDNDD